jgi:hypothetical protein
VSARVDFTGDAALPQNQRTAVPEEASVAKPADERPVYRYHFKEVTIAPASAEEPKIQHFSAKLAADYMEQGALA